ncbi:MAG: hypothetical protein DKT66_04855 [Candidatus Melainabacteria bacterium]|nr:MAG: hypothetical protein DKT66_04855 [Candidatus Melainabacteria bacterium]
MATMTDETGIVTKWNYDTDTEVLLSVVRDFGTSPHLNLTTAFEYDNVGNVVTVTNLITPGTQILIPGKFIKR